ncbi:MAG: POTRA domain-containing protein [Deltaproteobacteria bacterium]
MRGYRIVPYAFFVLCIAVAVLLCSFRVSAREPGKTGGRSNSVAILFQGNKALGQAALEKAAAEELKAFEQEGRKRSDIDDAAFQMKLAYRKAGYAFATVDYSIEESGGTVTITFTVAEGPLVHLKNIRNGRLLHRRERGNINRHLYRRGRPPCPPGKDPGDGKPVL